MLLHGLSPGMQDHRKTDLTTEIFLPELFEQLCGGFNEKIEKKFLIESHQRIENMVNREDHMIIMDRQNPEFLSFEPLRLFKRTALGAMPILAGLIKELPTLAFGASLQDTTQGRRAASHDRAHGFGLLIRKSMSFFVFPNMFAEDVSHVVFHP